MNHRLLCALAATLLAGPALAQAPSAPAPVTDLGPGLTGAFFPPARAGGPTVLVLGGSEGGLRGSQPIAARLSSEGYGALALAYFDVPGAPKTLQEAPLEYFDRAIAWLQAQPPVGRRRVAIVGGSKGAEAALLVAARNRQVCAVVVGAPSSVAWLGINPADFRNPKPSWTVGGQPVPSVPYDRSKPFTSVFDLYERSLPAAPSEARISVEKIDGPVLLISGRQDRLWPSTLMSDQMIARLDAAKFRYPHKHLAYDDAGHAVFGPPLRPGADLKPLAAFGGTPEGNQAARADSWPKALTFLSTALNGRGCAPRR